MNILNDAEILKALLPETSKSIYKLRDELVEKLGKENVDYATLLRNVNGLLKTGFIKEEKGITKKGAEDKRGTRRSSINFKGIVFLILNATLTKEETDSIMARLLSKPEIQRHGLDLVAVKDMTSEAFRKTLDDLKPKVNLQHYDEEYVQNLFNDTLTDNLLGEILPYLKKNFPDENLERYVKKKARKGLPEINEAMRMSLSVYDHLKSKRDFYVKKIEILKPFIKAFEKVSSHED